MSELLSIFKAVDENPLSIVEYKNNKPFYASIHYGFKPTAKFNFPETEPPYISVEVSGKLPTKKLQDTWHTWRYFCGRELNSLRRERMFIDLLECLPVEEAKFLLLIKDQNITSKHPNITASLLEETKFLL